MSSAARFLLSQFFPCMFTLRDAEGRVEHRPEGLLTATAVWMSRFYLPRAALTFSRPRYRRRIRAAGKGFWIFYLLALSFWATISLCVCLFLRPRAPLMVEAGKVALRAEAEWFTVSDMGFFKAFLRFIQYPSPWVHALVSFGVLTFLAAMSRRGGKWPSSNLRVLVTVLLWFAYSVTRPLATLVLATSIYAIAFPGLFGGEPTGSVLPWWLWLASAWTLAAWKEFSQENPRIREFTSALNDPSAMYKIGPTSFSTLISFAHFLFISVMRPRRLPRTLPHDENVRGHDAVRRDFFNTCLTFYHSENLDCLIRDPNNPERAYYTAKQRDYFDETYAKLLEQLGRVERRDRWDRKNANAATTS